MAKDKAKDDAAEAPKPPATRKARVTIPDSHVGTIECEFAADAKDARAAAIEAAKAARGIVGFGAEPQIEFLD